VFLFLSTILWAKSAWKNKEERRRRGPAWPPQGEEAAP